MTKVSPNPLVVANGRYRALECQGRVCCRVAVDIPGEPFGNVPAGSGGQFEFASREGADGNVEDEGKVAVSGDGDGDRVISEQRNLSAGRCQARAGNRHADADEVLFESHTGKKSRGAEVPGSACRRRCRPRTPRLGHTLDHGESPHELSESAVTIYAGETRSFVDDLDLWCRIRDLLAELPDVAPEAHAPVAVDAAQIRLQQRLGDEESISISHAPVCENAMTDSSDLISRNC